jgi:hypothetical protein
MSDHRAREAKIRWERSGTPEDRLAWLTARVRAGELTESRLEVASWCGDAEAAQVLGGDWPELCRYWSAPEFATPALTLWLPRLNAWHAEHLTGLRAACTASKWSVEQRLIHAPRLRSGDLALLVRAESVTKLAQDYLDQRTPGAAMRWYEACRGAAPTPPGYARGYPLWAPGGLEPSATDYLPCVLRAIGAIAEQVTEQVTSLPSVLNHIDRDATRRAYELIRKTLREWAVGP